MLFLKKIYYPEEQKERAMKALELNSNGTGVDKLQAASSSTKKPTIRIKRLSFSGQGIKLKGASSIREEREKAMKALRLNGLV